jgi:hypothetical protein
MLGGFLRYASAYELLSGDLILRGWVENFTAYMPSEIAGTNNANLSNFRNTIQGEAEYKLSKELKLYGIFKYFYDGAFDLDDEYVDKVKDDLREPWSRDIVKELYLDMNLGNLFVRIGKQQVVWGEADGLRLADIINPLDLSSHYIFETWEDIRIPNWMGRMIYSIPSSHSYNVELVVIPAHFNPTRIAPEGAPWAFPGYPQFIIDAIYDSVPDLSLKNAEVGLRVGGHFGGADIKLFNYYTRAQLPIFEPDWLARLGEGRTDLFSFKREDIVGGSFNYFDNFTGGVFRGEITFTIDHAFNRTDFTQVDKNVINYMIGLDRPTYFKFLNENSFFLSAQFFQMYILDHEADLMSSYTGGHKDLTALTFLINTSYWHDRIVPQVFAAHEVNGSGWIQPQISYNPGDHWRFTLGGNVLYGHDPFGYFGPFGDSSEVFFRLRYYFI